MAGAQFLPDGSAADQAARDYAEANWPGLSPDIDFWCVVGVNASGNPETTHIPAMCDPGPGPYTAANYPGLDCNSRMCLIPCNPLSPELDTCNTMRVRAQAAVDYAFASLVGIDQGSTGVLASASCKGPCGAEISVPGRHRARPRPHEQHATPRPERPRRALPWHFWKDSVRAATRSPSGPSAAPVGAPPPAQLNPAPT